MLSLRRTIKCLPVQEALVPVKLKKQAKPLFGRVQSEAFYRMSKDFIFEHKLCRLLDIELWDDTEVYTFCNLWRVEKVKGDLICYEFCLKTKYWYEIEPAKLPHMTLLHFHGASPENHLLKAMGCKLIAYFLDIGVIDAVLVRGSEDEKSIRRWGFIMEQIVKGLTRKADAKGASRSIMKSIWRIFIGRELYRNYMAIKDWPETPFLDEYVMCYQYRHGLAKVAKEHSNLLPLLRYIHPEYWKNDDLFAEKNWRAESVLLKQKAFYHQFFKDYYFGSSLSNALPYSGFTTKTGFKWLMKLDRSIVRKIIYRSNRFRIAASLSDVATKLELKIPPKVFIAAMKAFSSNRDNTGENFEGRPAYGYLLRLFVLECRRHRKAFQRQDFREEMEGRLSDILRWIGQVGEKEGQPNKFSTWKSLNKKHEEWIEDLFVKSRGRNLKWVSPLAACEIDEFRIIPLETSQALLQEGREMHHCIADYDYDCFKNHYLAFSLHDTEKDQSFTLGVRFSANGQWDIDQIRSYCNGKASTSAKKVAVDIVALINKKTQVVDLISSSLLNNVFEETDELEGFMEG